jgi:hypothetical protein
MHTEIIKIDRGEAAALYRKYKEHQAYSEPIDWEVQRTYQLLASGKVIIRAIESIKQAGLNREFLPKLAIAPAHAKECHLTRRNDGSMTMSPHERWSRKVKDVLTFRENTFVFPAESFPIETWGTPPRRRSNNSEHVATLPPVPVHLRPRRGLENYHVLWEAEWERIPPRDPYLLRRIGKADLWLVVAHWDLTEVERAALATRM